MQSLNTQPLVSIMMPAYNAAPYIEEAIKSICAQTYLHWQLICYDDGSTDETVSLVAALAATEPRIQLHRGVHGGRGKARNAALQYCNGDLVAMCDADDISLPHRFAEQVDFLNKNPGIDAVGGYQIPFSGALPSQDGHVIVWPTEVQAIAEKFDALRMGMPNCAVMIRRKCFDRVGGFDEALLRSQDFGFFLKLHRAGGRFANLAMPLVYYRQEGNIPSYSYWLDSEKYHALAVDRAGLGGRAISLAGQVRRVLNRRLMRPRYVYFKLRRYLEIQSGKKG